MELASRTEELKQLIWDVKLKDEIQQLCEMVNPSTSASLVQSLEHCFEQRLKYAVELELLKLKGLS